MIRRLALIAALLAPAATHAQDAGRGEALYRRHCVTCHGTEARGGGPMVTVLTVQPTDLTRLSANNGGTFPTFRVVRRIDGRDPLVAHGSSMPVYGDFFEGNDTAIKTPAGQPVMTSQPVADLVTWLLTLQD
jgi:hypothetical protein